MIRIVGEGSFRILIYTRDHEPAHVHVLGSGGEAKVQLGLDGEPPILIEAQRLKRSDVRKAVDLVEVHQDMLWTAWRRIHG